MSGPGFIMTWMDRRTVHVPRGSHGPSRTACESVRADTRSESGPLLGAAGRCWGLH